MEKLTENMIRWAENKLGSTKYAEVFEELDYIAKNGASLCDGGAPLFRFGSCIN